MSMTRPTPITLEVPQIVKSTTGIGRSCGRSRSGPTLDSIALRQCGEVNDRIIADILRANHLNAATKIYPGESLVMPGLKAGTPDRSADPLNCPSLCVPSLGPGEGTSLGTVDTLPSPM